MILNISGDIGLVEVDEAATYVQERIGDEAYVIFGAVPDSNVQDKATITVIATGLEEVVPAVKTPSFMNQKNVQPNTNPNMLNNQGVPNTQPVQNFEDPAPVQTPVQPQVAPGFGQNQTNQRPFVQRPSTMTTYNSPSGGGIYRTQTNPSSGISYMPQQPLQPKPKPVMPPDHSEKNEGIKIPEFLMKSTKRR